MNPEILRRVEVYKNQVAPHIPFDPLTYLKFHGFFEAPASTKYHGSKIGGLFDHSINVMNALVDMTKKMNLKWNRPESPYIVGFFHDLCKIDSYITDDHGQTFQYNTNTLIKGHGDKSIMLLSTLARLTEEEVACIRYHMGAFTDKEQWNDYTNAIHRYPNVLWTHTADMVASHIEEV